MFSRTPLFAQAISPGEVTVHSWPYKPPAPILKVESNTVEVGTVVRDSKGQIVPGLKQSDFKIYDEGKEQSISAFSVETHLTLAEVRHAAASAKSAPAETPPPRPRFVALFFDDLNTTFGDMRHVQLAAENFVKTGVGPSDKVALFTSSGSQTVDFTPNAPEVISAIENLKFRGRSIASPGCPHISPYDAYEIANEPLPPISDQNPPMGSPTYVTIVGEAYQCNCYDETNLEPMCVSQQEQLVQTESKQMWSSIREMSQDTLNSIQAVVNYLTKRPGDRVLVLASSGFMTQTLETEVDTMVDNALRAGVVINALDAKGLYTEVPNQSEMESQSVDMADAVAAHETESLAPRLTSLTGAMVDFAVGTGGRFFHNRNDLTAGYYSLAAAPHIEYLLGFAPEEAKLNGAFHKLKVEVNLPGKFDVETRPGYFAVKREKPIPAAPTTQEIIDQQVKAAADVATAPATVTYRLQRAASGSQELVAEFHVDLKNLPVVQQQDRTMGDMVFVAALFDSNGAFVEGKEAQMSLALKANTFADLSKTGIKASMVLPASPGTYRLRLVMRESVKGELLAQTDAVAVH
ncbi:MAG TPA: VWA domain-containing protein [Candidatus Acidoferrales bacterium]|nr:VWA domain-containing protein [Candidatus Acidoferrales bacterium]